MRIPHTSYPGNSLFAVTSDGLTWSLYATEADNPLPLAVIIKDATEKKGYRLIPITSPSGKCRMPKKLTRSEQNDLTTILNYLIMTED